MDKWVLEVDKRILSVENTAYYVDLLFFAVSKGYSSSLSSELGVVLKYLVKKKMWNVVKGTSKYKYVSNPNRGGGLHNYGLAVDISIQDSLGQPLPMGTKVDHLGMEAHITDEIGLVHNGKMSETERQNRLLLRKVMKETGFRALPSEWWHFNFCSRDVAKQKYKLIP